MIRIQWGGHNNKKRTGKVAENSKDKKDSQDKKEFSRQIFE